MFSLFILLRTPLSTTFVKELPFLKSKQKRAARVPTAVHHTRATFSRGRRFSRSLPVGCFRLLSLKGETSSERTELLSYLKKTIEGITYLGVQLFR